MIAPPLWEAALEEREGKSKKSSKTDTGAASAVTGTLPEKKDNDDEFNAGHIGEGEQGEGKCPHIRRSTGIQGPPTVQASSKKKVKHERRVVEESKVEVIPPAAEATPGELMMRDELVNALKATLGSSNTKRALNACREMMATYGKLVTESLEALWNAALLSKRAWICSSSADGH